MYHQTYRPKKLIDGYRVSKAFQGMYLVAIPTVKVESGVAVTFNDEVMYIDNDSYCLGKKLFEDRYGRYPYTLHYYEWKPALQTLF